MTGFLSIYSAADIRDLYNANYVIVKKESYNFGAWFSCLRSESIYIREQSPFSASKCALAFCASADSDPCSDLKSKWKTPSTDDSAGAAAPAADPSVYKNNKY